MKQNDKAIFLHRINYSESSLITTFYTLHHGIQKFIFQGGKKKSSSLFPLSVSEITFYRRPDSELGKLTEVQSIDPLNGILSDPIRSTIAFFIADVLKNCLKTDQSDPLLFEFLEERIQSLDRCDANSLSLYPTEFLIGFTFQMGIEPRIPDGICSHFYIEEGEFSNLERKGDLVANGPGVKLIQQLLKVKRTQEPTRIDRQDAFEVMLSYYKLHIPGFNIDQSLEIIREILYN